MATNVAPNVALNDQVLSNIAVDPRIPAPLEIAAEVDDGVATLRGTVESFPQKRAAVRDASKVQGVRAVDDHLRVSPVGSALRGDEEIRGIAHQRLMWDAELPEGAVNVKVDDGWVTLKGEVKFQFQSDAAFADVASLYGVIGITNEIHVVTY